MEMMKMKISNLPEGTPFFTLSGWFIKDTGFVNGKFVNCYEPISGIYHFIEDADV